MCVCVYQVASEARRGRESVGDEKENFAVVMLQSSPPK